MEANWRCVRARTAVHSTVKELIHKWRRAEQFERRSTLSDQL